MKFVFLFRRRRRCRQLHDCAWPSSCASHAGRPSYAATRCARAVRYC